MHVVITSTIVSVIQLKLYILISSFLYILRVSFTLTGYNSEYQNKCFVDKLDCKDKQGNNIGYRHTPIKISHSLIKYNQWGEKEILARTNQLVNKLIEIWEYPISKDE